MAPASSPTSPTSTRSRSWPPGRRISSTTYEGVSYPDAQQLFSLGDGAIYPAGSWDIAFFQSQGVPIGFFGPPVANEGDTCYISDHTDIAMGLNAASPNQEAARTFLDWVASDEFAQLYSNALPGFYSLSNSPVTLDNEVAQQALDLRAAVRIHHPQLVPDPLPWRAQSGERAVAQERCGHQRDDDSRRGCRRAAGRPR